MDPDTDIADNIEIEDSNSNMEIFLMTRERHSINKRHTEIHQKSVLMTLKLRYQSILERSFSENKYFGIVIGYLYPFSNRISMYILKIIESGEREIFEELFNIITDSKNRDGVRNEIEGRIKECADNISEQSLVNIENESRCCECGNDL